MSRHDRRGPVAALAAFELRRLARSPGALAGAAGFVLVLAVGHAVYWSALPPRPADDRMFGWAYLIGAFGLLRFGLAEDRELSFDECLVVNLTTPARYLAGKLLAVAAALVAYGAGAFLAASAFGAGDWRFAAWYAVLFTLVAWLFLPGLLLVELVAGTRYPAAALFVAFAAALAVARAVSSPMVVVEALGLDVERFDWSSLAPLAGRALVSSWLLVLLYPLSRLRLTGRAAWSRLGA